MIKSRAFAVLMLYSRRFGLLCSIGWSAGCHGHDVYGRPVDDEGISAGARAGSRSQDRRLSINPEIVIFFRLHATERNSTCIPGAERTPLLYLKHGDQHAVSRRVRTPRLRKSHCAELLGRRLTYGEIAAEACRVAAGLQSFGVHKGDRVGLYFRNCPQLLASLIACWRVGAVAVPIRRWQSAEMTVSWCNYLGVVCLLIDEALEEKLAPHLEQLISCRNVVSTAAEPSIAMQRWSALVANDGHHARAAVDEREPALILHTSGTTARPKAIAHNLRGLNDRARALLQHLPIEPEDVVCVFSDCSHAFGLNVMAAPALAAGATVLLIPEFDPKAILREMSKHGATVMGGAPGYLLSLLDEARKGVDPANPSSGVRSLLATRRRKTCTVSGRRSWAYRSSRLSA